MLKIRMPLTKTASKLTMQRLVAAASSRAVAPERTRKIVRLTAIKRKRVRMRVGRMIRLKRIMRVMISTFSFNNAIAKSK